MYFVLSQSKLRHYLSENKKYSHKNWKDKLCWEREQNLAFNWIKEQRKKSVGWEGILLLADIHIHMVKWNRIGSIFPIRNGILLMKNTFKHYDPVYGNGKCKLLAVMVL